MKKLLLLLLCVPLIGLGQQTYVPDSAFEAYLEANGMGNGIFNDDSVFTSAIDTVTNLDVSSQNIADLIGIEDFSSLQYLDCSNNQLTRLELTNVSSLTNLLCSDNQLKKLDLSNMPEMHELECSNNQLTRLTITKMPKLHYINCSSNRLREVDVRHCDSDIFLECDQSVQIIQNSDQNVEVTRV